MVFTFRATDLTAVISFAEARVRAIGRTEPRSDRGSRKSRSSGSCGNRRPGPRRCSGSRAPRFLVASERSASWPLGEAEDERQLDAGLPPLWPLERLLRFVLALASLPTFTDAQ